MDERIAEQIGEEMETINDTTESGTWEWYDRLEGLETKWVAYSEEYKEAYEIVAMHSGMPLYCFRHREHRHLPLQEQRRKHG